MAAERDFASETDDDGQPVGPMMQTCVRIVHGNKRGMDTPEHPAAGQLAAVLDGSGYAARLVVLPAFGCVLHEPKTVGGAT
jgi:hypothetical protein